MIKNAAILHAILLPFISGLLWYMLGREAAISAVVVGLILVVNILSMTYVVHRLMYKKSIALPTTLIILKYPIIAIVLVTLAKQPWIRWTGVMTAVVLFVLCFLIAGIQDARLKLKTNNQI